MLRVLNEAEMEMVSGGNDVDDEIIVRGVRITAIDPDARSIYIGGNEGGPGGTGGGGPMGPPAPEDCFWFRGDCYDSEAAREVARQRFNALQDSVNPSNVPSIPDPRNFQLDSQTRLRIGVDGNITEGTVSGGSVTITRQNR